MAKNGKGPDANPSKHAGRVGKPTPTGRTTSVLEKPGKAGGTSKKDSALVKGKPC